MKSEKSILTAFILNLAFAIFEFAGGIFTGSAAIASDAVHDIGDAASIGVSYFLEKKSKKQPDNKYTYGYAGYSAVGGAFTTLVLLFGSLAVIFNAVGRIIEPARINSVGMIFFAIIGTCVNLCAAILTCGGNSPNRKAVNLHMLEDVLGWIVVLIGAVVMHFTGFALIDPIMSIGVAVFIILSAIKNMGEILGIFLWKTPDGIDVDEIKKHLSGIDGVVDVHHLHIWSMDGHNNYATLHIVAKGNFPEIKRNIRKELNEHGISHATLELEAENEICCHKTCHTESGTNAKHHHHHHHHPHHH